MEEIKKPEYLVIPFRPTLKKGGKYGEIADQVHELISIYVTKGWEYVAIEKIEATIENPLGPKPTFVQVMIFKK